jgi:hypothetical protein
VKGLIEEVRNKRISIETDCSGTSHVIALMRYAEGAAFLHAYEYKSDSKIIFSKSLMIS